jgi:hypothetical protein
MGITPPLIELSSVRNLKRQSSKSRREYWQGGKGGAHGIAPSQQRRAGSRRGEEGSEPQAGLDNRLPGKQERVKSRKTSPVIERGSLTLRAT